MATTLKKLTPNLMVEDVNRSLAFYQDVLGFETLATVPEEGQFQWAMMKRGNVEIMFQAQASLSGEIPLFEGATIGASLTLYIEVDGIADLYATVQGKAPIAQEMHETFYHAKEFAIQDCNGYVLAFAETQPHV